MKPEDILHHWKTGSPAPVYWLEGEEEYFIEQLLSSAGEYLLPAEQRDFNLTVFYGRDCQWADLLNACRRYPMFAERQVVILREAQSMRDLDKMEAYLEQPMATTVWVVGYKDKKLDARKRFSKLVKEKGVVLTTRKLYANELLGWGEQWLRAQNRMMSERALALLIDFVGDDLSRMVNELEKLVLNVPASIPIQDSHIEKYVGISRGYNPFELQRALANRQLQKAIQIIQYFESNPKAGPIQLLLPTLYSFFSKCMLLFGPSSGNVAALLGVPPFAVKEYQTAVQLYGYSGLEQILLLLHEYNLRAVGVGDPGTSDGELMKELIIKIVRSGGK
ncbi:MAG: DNA polymerase III subunit delta [Bacteroidetes bacterium]|nr:DNA polymerase III subunit delta [Bacteroidota bacterium]